MAAATTGVFPFGVRHIQYGEPLASAVARRPDMDLDDRTKYLLDRVNASEIGMQLQLSGAIVAADVETGMPVYLSPTTQVFERALATVSDNGVIGNLDLDASAFVTGVVATKYADTIADIVVAGVSVFDLTAAYGADPPLGVLYLSSQTAGHLVTQRPDISVPVLYHLGGGLCKVLGAIKNPVDDHVHVQYTLVCRPAGTHVPPDTTADPHVITAADSDLPGWLPADDDVFEGLAPAGAKFGYNLTQDPAVNSSFPPIPPSSARVFFDRGDSYNAALVSSEYCVIDVNGIWWMTDCYGEVPWDPTLDTNDPEDGTSVGDDCPTAAVRVTVFGQLALFATKLSTVTSLRPKTGSTVSLKDASGDDATAGDLTLDVEVNPTVDSGDLAGGLVVKETDGLTLKRGYVAEALVAGDNISYSSTHPVTIDGVVHHRGVITASVSAELAGAVLIPDLVRFGRTVDRNVNGIPYIGFPADGATSKGIRLRFKVPLNGLPANPGLTVVLSIMGVSAGELPDLAMTYRRLPQSTSFQSLPTTDQTGELDTGGVLTANQYKLFSSDPIPVAAGDVVLVTISRTTPDTYSGEVGILDQYGTLVQIG